MSIEKIVSKALLYCSVSLSALSMYATNVYSQETSPKDVVVVLNNQFTNQYTTTKLVEEARLKRDIDRIIEKALQDKRLIGAEFSLLVTDFKSGEVLFEINKDEPRQAASMIKIPVVVAYLHQMNKGKVEVISDLSDMLTKLIRYKGEGGVKTSNDITNTLIKRLGGPMGVQKVLRDNYVDIFQHTLITEYIPPNGRTYLNKASASDYSRLLHALWNEKIPFSKYVTSAMGLQKRMDRLKKGTKIPSNVKLHNKTGTTSKVLGDFGILVTKDKEGNIYPYSVIGIIQNDDKTKMDWTKAGSNIIREISDEVYGFMRLRYSLNYGKTF